MDPSNFPIPFPRATKDGRIIVDEMCDCGRRRSQHNGIGPAWGHGACRASGCAKFTWVEHVFGSVAFAATMPATGGFGVGLATENEDGYLPRPDLGSFPTWDAAQERATELNEALGHSSRRAFDIVVSSMRDGTVRP